MHVKFQTNNIESLKYSINIINKCATQFRFVINFREFVQETFVSGIHIFIC